MFLKHTYWYAYVSRRIQEGEEIVASYISLTQLPLRQKRREMLMPTWNFVCRLTHSSFPEYQIWLGWGWSWTNSSTTKCMFMCWAGFYFFVCFRCELCSLTEEELEQNEELRTEIFNLERVADNLYDVGLNGQGLQKLEQKVELMEQHWKEFCMEVTLWNNFSGLKLLWFSSFQSCTTAVSLPQ